MNHEQVPPQENAQPPVAEQMEIDFAAAEKAAAAADKEAAIKARAWELKKENGWMLSYAESIARIEMKKKEWDEKPNENEAAK